MDFLALFLALAVVWTAIDGAFRSGADGPNWNLRRQSLEPAERARISAAAGSYAKFTDPEEAELAAGFARHDRRRHAYIDLTAAPVVLVAAALALTGALPTGDFSVIASLALLFGSFVVPRLVRREDGASRDAAPPEADL